MRKIETKDIPGYEGLYYLTPQGEVYAYGKNKPLKPFNKKSSCCYLGLFKDRTRKTISMPKIICMCYFGGIKYRFEHKNGDIYDYSYENLIPKRCNQKKLSKGRKKPIVRIKDGEVTFYGSGKECAKDNYVPPSAITNYCKGKIKPLNDVTFMYESDYYREHGEEYACDKTCKAKNRTAL